MPQVLFCCAKTQRLASLHLVRCDCVFISGVDDLVHYTPAIVVLESPPEALVRHTFEHLGSANSVVVLIIDQTFDPYASAVDGVDITWDFLPAAAPIGWLSRAIQRWVDRAASTSQQGTTDARHDADKMVSGFQALFQMLPVPALMVTENHQIHDVNKAYLSQFGYRRKTLQQRDIQSLVSWEHQSALLALLSNSDALTGSRVTLPLLNGEGKIQGRSAVIASIVLAAHPAKWLVYVPAMESKQQLTQDLAVLRRSLNSMVDAQVADRLNVQQEIESAERLMNEFLESMSYGFRTPLTDILGFAGLGQEEAELADADALKWYFECIQCSGRTMISLINDLLDLSKFEADEMQLYLIPGQVDQLIHQILLELDAPITQAGLTCYIDDHTPWPQIAFEENRLHRAMLAILLYIVQHSDENSMLNIHVKTVSEQDRSHLLIHFCSGGLHLSGDLNTLFNKLGHSRKKDFVSSLALPLAKEIVEAHGGSVYAQANAHSVDIVVKLRVAA